MSKQDKSIETGRILHQLGNLYHSIGNRDEAIKYYQKSLQIKSKAAGKANFEMATSINNLGLIYLEQGDLAKAL